MRGGQSSLNPPLPVSIPDLKRNNKGFKDIRNPDGSRKTSTDVDLNVCYDPLCPPRNVDHWPILALVRELYANAIDAAFAGTQHTWRGESPTVKGSNTLIPLAGFTALNGHLAASWTVSIDKVKENPKFDQNSRETAELPPKYIEIVPFKVKKVTKKGKKRSRRDDDEEDGGGDGDDDDDDSDYEEGEGEDDEKEEKQQDAGAWDADDFDDETCYYRVALYIRSFSVLPLEAWVNAFSSKNNVTSDVLR